MTKSRSRRIFRGASLAAAAACGAFLGAVAALASQGEPASTPTTSTTATSAVAAPVDALPTKVPQPTTGLLLAWTPTALPAGFGAALAVIPGVTDTTVVRLDVVNLEASADPDGKPVDRPPAGYTIPVEVMAFDPATYPPTLAAADRAAFLRLRDGEALLGATEAGMRHVRPGGTLTIDGVTLRVADVVGDEVIGAAEVAVNLTTGATIGVTTEKYALLVHDADRAAIESAARASLPAGVAVRFRAPGETPYLRYGDAVLPQVFVKQRFGEFAWRPVPGRTGDFEEDPAWVKANIVQADVPILGPIRCNRNLVQSFAGALQQLQQEDLASLVDPGAYQGCWVPRLTRTGSGISRHAWGVAVDVNFTANRTGLGSAQDERLVAAMARWGFTWGGNWLVPDPAHFEYLSPPP